LGAAARREIAHRIDTTTTEEWAAVAKEWMYEIRTAASLEGGGYRSLRIALAIRITIAASGSRQ